MDFNIKVKLNNNKINVFEIHYFEILIGFLLFLVLVNRSNITFIIIKLTKFAFNLNLDYLKTIKRIYNNLRNYLFFS
jgi:uncharacterized membrane protein